MLQTDFIDAMFRCRTRKSTIVALSILSTLIFILVLQLSLHFRARELHTSASSSSSKNSQNTEQLTKLEHQRITNVNSFVCGTCQKHVAFGGYHRVVGCSGFNSFSYAVLSALFIPSFFYEPSSIRHEWMCSDSSCSDCRRSSVLRPSSNFYDFFVPQFLRPNCVATPIRGVTTTGAVTEMLVHSCSYPRRRIVQSALIEVRLFSSSSSSSGESAIVDERLVVVVPQSDFMDDESSKPSMTTVNGRFDYFFNCHEKKIRIRDNNAKLSSKGKMIVASFDENIPTTKIKPPTFGKFGVGAGEDVSSPFLQTNTSYWRATCIDESTSATKNEELSDFVIDFDVEFRKGVY